MPETAAKMEENRLLFLTPSGRFSGQPTNCFIDSTRRRRKVAAVREKGSRHSLLPVFLFTSMLAW